MSIHTSTYLITILIVIYNYVISISILHQWDKLFYISRSWLFHLHRARYRLLGISRYLVYDNTIRVSFRTHHIFIMLTQFLDALASLVVSLFIVQHWMFRELYWIELKSCIPTNSFNRSFRNIWTVIFSSTHQMCGLDAELECPYTCIDVTVIFLSSAMLATIIHGLSYMDCHHLS